MNSDFNVLKNLPKNTSSVRINTNCSIVIDEIEHLLEKNIQVTVTVSLDGIEEVHDHVRWPIKWEKFYANLMHYKGLEGINLNTWTTVSALNIHNFVSIKQFVANHQLDHSYAFLHDPHALNVKFKNNLTLPYKNLFPGLVAIYSDNQLQLDNFLDVQSRLRNTNEQI